MPKHADWRECPDFSTGRGNQTEPSGFTSLKGRVWKGQSNQNLLCRVPEEEKKKLHKKGALHICRRNFSNLWLSTDLHVCERKLRLEKIILKGGRIITSTQKWN